MSSKSPICKVPIVKLSSSCHQSHQFAKCTLPNCQVHVINSHYQCHIAKSPSCQVHIVKLSSPCHQSTSSMPHCQVTFNLQVAHQTIQNYESLRMAPFMKIFPDLLDFYLNLKSTVPKRRLPTIKKFWWLPHSEEGFTWVTSSTVFLPSSIFKIFINEHP